MQPIIYYSGQQVKEEEEQEEQVEGGGGCTQQPVLLPFCMNVRAQQLLQPESPTHTLLSPSAGSDQLVLIHFLSCSCAT